MGPIGLIDLIKRKAASGLLEKEIFAKNLPVVAERDSTKRRRTKEDHR